MTQFIPLQQKPSQTLTVSLDGQRCRINLYQRTTGMFCDLLVNDVPIVVGVICQDRNDIVRDRYLGFLGDLRFVDIQGTSDPDYTQLGTRFALAYVEDWQNPMSGTDVIDKGTGNFVRRKIDVIIRLGKGDYGAGGYDTMTMKGLRISANIHKAGDMQWATANVRIYGMLLDHMNTLTTLGKPQIFERDNQITLMAGNEGGAMSVVYMGVIQEAWANFDAMPDVGFEIFAQTGSLEAMKPVPASSYPGAADAVVILQSLAKLMNKKFENNGVPTTMLDNPYLPGTALMQVETCARAADIGWTLDNDTLAIFPIFGNRAGDVPLISARTGMIGYPSYIANGIRLRTAYNPAVIFNGNVKVESDLKAANGTWTINVLTHDLASETPDGPWFTEMEGYRLGQSPTIPAG